MGALAESFGLRQGLKYRKAIKDELETVLRLAPLYEDRSADRALGRWYFKVPTLFGGSHTLAEEHLRASLTVNEHSTASHYFLAELLLDDGRKAEARAELQKVLDAPLDPEWTPEDQDFKEKARILLRDDARRLRDHGSARRGRHGRGVPSARHEARARRRDQDSARSVRRRP
ncbi:MAG: tetratricopeptide repeat protein [Acidobacteria bacterium]|nr:tetratricopeptide repeat protein [Acidobacteriota bacterium]